MSWVLPLEVSLHILGYVGLSAKGARGQGLPEDGVRVLALTRGCPVECRATLRLPWRPRELVEGEWLLPRPSHRLVSVQTHGAQALTRNQQGDVHWRRDQATGLLVRSSTHLLATEWFVLVRLEDGSVLLWRQLSGSSEVVAQDVVDLACFEQTFVLLGRNGDARLYDLRVQPQVLKLPGEFRSVLCCVVGSAGALKCIYVLETHSTASLLEVSPALLEERAKPGVRSSRWSSPLGSCGSSTPLPSLAGWNVLERPSRGLGLKDLGCGYAHLGRGAGAVLKLPSILSVPEAELSSHFALGCSDVACCTINAWSVHFHVLLVLFHPDGSSHVWTWCMHWNWLLRARLHVATPRVSSTLDRYLAVMTSAHSWEVFDLDKAHQEERFRTSVAADEVVFSKAGGSPDWRDEYVMITTQDGLAEAAPAPNCCQVARLPSVWSLFRGRCWRVLVRGLRSVACVLDDGMACVVADGKLSTHSGVADVVFSPNGRAYALTTCELSSSAELTALCQP